ncbi:hypothetical protein HNP81_004313 [Peribacillus huizhouensis]|uniref:Uncharacterized protein n=1 Tax=Peribacillus huizhouensis TaxID=1501239 RepID=A0ABR6CVP6_9BACI|nr:hypothetical protein [Peribacillus huizhouensis]
MNVSNKVLVQKSHLQLVIYGFFLTLPHYEQTEGAPKV